MDVVFTFEVHQPFRVRGDFFWERRMFQRLSVNELFEYYFDEGLDRTVFERVSRKCYLPANNIVLNLIDEFKREKKVKVAYSLSGVFLEQCERYNKDVLESFRQLAETGCVEFLEQTYFHSLCSLYPTVDEFTEQVEMHRKTMEDLIHFTPRVFENTELLYNNAIAKIVEKLGYLGMFAEGVERVLGGMSPNYVYSAKGCDSLKVLLRNHQLTDDIGFRFSSRRWSEWPLEARKYASWLRGLAGQCVNIFPDYETFGEHHWPETGIQAFLDQLPREILKEDRLHMTTPSEVLSQYKPVGELDVHELATTSWADEKRDTSGWLGNTMQWAYYKTTRDLAPLVRESWNSVFVKLWRYFQQSDHLHYMYTSTGEPREVHEYFSHYQTPTDAFITCQTALMDFEARLRQYILAGNTPFKFFTGVGEPEYTGKMAYSLNGFIEVLSLIDEQSIEFHDARGDFEKWAQHSLRDQRLETKFRGIRELSLRGDALRKKLIQVATRHLRMLR